MSPSPRKPSRKSPPSDAPSLSLEMIIDAGVTLIDRAGLESFSLRNLAQSLGVYPTAIYWYVPNRNALMAQVVASVLSNVVPGRSRRRWQDGLRELFHNFRNALRMHPNISPLISGQLVSNANVNLEMVEYILASLSKAPLSGTPLVGAYNTILATLVGFTTQEFAPIPHEDAAQWQNTVQNRLLAVNGETQPLLSRNMHNLTNRAFILRWQNGVEAPLDASFDLCIDLLIGGIEALANHGPGDRPAPKPKKKSRVSR